MKQWAHKISESHFCFELGKLLESFGWKVEIEVKTCGFGWLDMILIDQFGEVKHIIEAKSRRKLKGIRLIDSEDACFSNQLRKYFEFIKRSGGTAQLWYVSVDWRNLITPQLISWAKNLK